MVIRVSNDNQITIILMKYANNILQNHHENTPI